MYAGFTMKKIIAFIAFLAILLSVYFSISTDFVFERYKIYNDDAQKILYQKLSAQNIMFGIADDGSVLFAPTDREIVHKFVDEAILESDTSSSITIKFSARKYAILLTDKLRN